MWPGVVAISFHLYALEGLISIPCILASMFLSSLFFMVVPVAGFMLPVVVNAQRFFLVVISHLAGHGLATELQDNLDMGVALFYPASAFALTAWYSVGLRLLLKQPRSMFTGALGKDVFVAFCVWLIVVNAFLASFSTVVFLRIGRQASANLPTLLTSTIRGKRLFVGMTLRQVFPTDSEDRCCICLSDFQEGEEVANLLCRHIFHSECIRRWLEVGGDTCPMRCVVDVPAVEFAHGASRRSVASLGDFVADDSSDIASLHTVYSHRDTSGSI